QLKARGEEIPPVMLKIANATQQIPKNIQTTTSAVTSLKQAMIGMFTIDKVIQFSKSILDLADNIQKLADTTGLTTDEVQRLQYIAGQSVNTIDDFTGAVTQMQNRLTSGDKSAVAALQRMGISLKDLQSRDSYDQLLLLSKGLQGIQSDANRTQTG